MYQFDATEVGSRARLRSPRLAGPPPRRPPRRPLHRVERQRILRAELPLAGDRVGSDLLSRSSPRDYGSDCVLSQQSGERQL